MAKRMSSTTMYAPSRKKRTGVHAKTKTSKLKNSRNYKKMYKGQGK